MDLLPADERKEIIARARKGSLRDLVVLAQAWDTLPNPLSEGIQSIFFRHLNSSDVPIKPELTTIDIEDFRDSIASGTLRAFWSLCALGKLTGLLSPLTTDPYGHEIVRAWPGIFKWSAFLYASHVQPPSVDPGDTTPSEKLAATRGMVRDVIATSWCALTGSKSAKTTMLQTHGVVEIAARLWVLEDDPNVTKNTPFGDGVPVGSLLLDQLSTGEGEAVVNHIITAAGGDLGRIARTSLDRLKKDFTSSQFPADPLDSTLHFNLVAQFCRSPNLEIRETFLNHGAILICVQLLIRIASVMNEEAINPDEKKAFLQLMTMGFWFLMNFLDTTSGVPWVLQAINSGLLTAFVECSPFYFDLKHDDYRIASATIVTTIPRYLAYLCVVQATDAAFLKLKRTPRFSSLRMSRAWKDFDSLSLLTAQRFGVISQVKFMKQNATICSNPKCQKLDVRNNFRKCAKCGKVLYCSKECQAIHWKELGHRQHCKNTGKDNMLPQEDGAVSQRDFQYLQWLNINQARYNLPHLKRLAAQQYPGVPLNDLMVVINYDELPFSTHVFVYSEWVRDHPEPLNGESLEQKYRPDLLVKEFTSITAIVACGKSSKLMLTRTPGPIWEWDRHPEHAGVVAKVDPAGKRIVDWKDKEAEARRRQYCGV
ncbi:hypothetical protein BDN72DRAFT_643162 [Pluteus cervinus]|uniref:Uncharacterized protein n=1 Tax=Pluteus cervinus TaxID=181527 RepID=A0ACD3AUG7_9AGAR|nr:hypothetical protein BDN72DRAFT_643162 [Pluteus cervinus]